MIKNEEDVNIIIDNFDLQFLYGRNYSYNLSSIILHHGRDIPSGHYTSI